MPPVTALQFDTLTMANARTVLAQGVAAMRAGQVDFDLAGVTTVDSSAVAVLLEWQRVARDFSLTPRFHNVSSNLQSLAKLYGVDSFLCEAAAPMPADLHHH